MHATIDVHDVHRAYGSGDGAFEAVRGVDLRVESGTIHSLLGVNGAGKTSLLEVIEGLATPSAGRVRVLGLDPKTDRPAVRRRAGVLLQCSGFSGDLTVRETLTMWAATVTDPALSTSRSSCSIRADGKAYACEPCPAESGGGSTWPAPRPAAPRC